MAIDGTKLMNLADGKLLYDDLRGRLESKSSIIYATDLEIQAIIDNYTEESEEEEDEGMVVETVYYNNGIHGQGFKSVMDYADIVSAFKAGKNVVIHFPNTENEPDAFLKGPDAYVALAYYADAGTLQDTSWSVPQFSISYVPDYIGYNIINELNNHENADHPDDGKLYFQFITD